MTVRDNFTRGDTEASEGHIFGYVVVFVVPLISGVASSILACSSGLYKFLLRSKRKEL